MTAAIELDAALFQNRLHHIKSLWKSSNETSSIGRCDAVMLTLGTPTDLTVYQKTTAMFSWLLGYEFPETVLLLTKEKSLFLCSQRKGAILDTIAIKDDTVKVFKRGKELGNNESLFKEIFSLISNKSDPPKIGVITKDKNEGPMIQEWVGYCNGKYEAVDITSDIGLILGHKDELEISYVKTASQLSSALMVEQITKKILGAIDEGKKISHSRISEDLETFVMNHVSRLKGRLSSDCGKVNMDYVDICYQPIIQSGGVYSLKPSAISNDDPLSGKGAILCSVGLRYRGYCSNISRTFLIDPIPGQEDTLIFLQSLQQYLASKLVPGAILSEIYEAGVNYVRERQGNLEGNLISNFGFGIGLEFRSPEFIINSKCGRKIESGMTFNLVVGFQELPGQAAMLLADTVQVDLTGAKFLTDGLVQLKEISYSIKDVKSNSANQGAPSTPIIKTRQRAKSSLGAKDESLEKLRREHQKELGQKRIKEALEKYGETNSSDNLAKKVEILKFESYRKDTMLPKDLGSGGSLKIHVDKRAETVILPIYGQPVPFHINTIKNVTRNEEGDYCYLRINFNSPGRTFGKKDNLPAFEDPSAHFVRGITMRTADLFRAQEIFKEINELKKQVAERELAKKERSDLVEQGQLVEVTGRRPSRLSDIYVRPGLDGKRLPGDLEIHSNGLRYRSQLKSDQRIDVLFSNIKHFFFQPCDHETLVILHLHLHHPIMIGKKKTKDIQFYREALESVVDETSGRRTKMRFGDEDEIAQEQEERKRRAEANEEFKNFSEKVVDASRNILEVDVPFRDIGFTGVPARQNVLLQPTTECLVHLIEPPFLIVTLSEVEVVFLERVVFGLKNFDLVFVFKDHSAAPVHVNTIPMTQLEAVKDWLDSVDVYFVETKVNFNWNNIMKTVNEDPVGFYEMGGWTYLQPDEAVQDDTGSDEGSSEYEPDDGEEEYESEEEEEYEESEEETEEESEEETEEEESEESDAPDWDELEEQARRDDERRSSVASKKRPEPPTRKSSGPAKRR